MILAVPLIRRFMVAAAAAMLVTGCSPSVDGGDGPAVEQPQPVTNTTGFDFDTNGTFVVGSSPRPPASRAA
jgi:hypothetical protein